jgi:dipeptidyl aminopeptidase/acylaminoacyl peptidase
MLNRLLFASLALCLALALPTASAVAAPAGSGAVVFSRVVTNTAIETVENEGVEESKETVTVEGGLYAVRDGRLNQLTEDPADGEPDFAPNGRAIAFSRGGDVFTVRADGSGLRRLTAGPELDTAPAVSVNGNFAVFERRASAGAPADLYTVRITGGAARALTKGGEDDGDASFSPDGRALVFVRSVVEDGGGVASDIYSVRPSGSGLARLTRTAVIDEFDPRHFAGGIVYSRGEVAEDESAYADVYTMRRNGRKVKPLVAGVGSAYVEDVTPDGRTVLFRRDQGLWVKRIGRGRARKLSELPDGSETNAVFSSDGRRVAAFVEADGREQLTSIAVATRSARALVEGFVPSETSPAGGTTTTIGPVIDWQPVRIPRR